MQPTPPRLPNKPPPRPIDEDTETTETGERRIDVRIDVRAASSPAAYILRRDDKEPVQIVNASYRGVFLRLGGAPPPQSQIMKLEIELPTKTVIVHAVPVRIVIDPAGRAGVGARFFALNGEIRQVWESFIASLITTRKSAA